MDFIHAKFKNMHKQRLEWLDAEDRSRVMQKQRSIEKIERIAPQKAIKEPPKKVNPRFAELE